MKARGLFTKMEAKFEPKVRVNLPTILNEVINTDVNNFSINKNRLCNMIFAYFVNHYQEIVPNDISLKDFHTLQFTLNQENQDKFMALCDTINLSTKADFFRRMILTYVDNPQFRREQIIFFNSTKMIEEAIKAKRKIKIRYKDEYRIIEPYFIAHSDWETRNYVFVYCENKKRFANYRLAKIHAISILKNMPWEHYETDYVKGVRNSFDAFLSYQQVIKVRLDESGVNMYKNNVTHRPKLLSQNDDLFEFECSPLKAQLYFPQFMYHAEIIEPNSLREWFRENFLMSLNIYK